MEHPNLWDQNLFKDVLKIGGLKFGKTQKLKEKMYTCQCSCRHATHHTQPSLSPSTHHSLTPSLPHTLTLTPTQDLPWL